MPTKEILLRPLFIVGVGRSGTSLLQSMLSAHSQIAFPPEFSFLRRYLAQSLLEGHYRAGELSEVRRLLEEDEQLSALELNLEAVVESALKRKDKRPFDAQVYEEILHSYAKKLGCPIVGDKDPRSVEYLPLIHRLWPKAKVIHIVRDPRDVLASKKKALWSKNRPSLFHIFANQVQLRMGRRSGHQLFRGNYIEVVYEKLIEDPEGELRRLCEFIGVSYESSLLQFQESAKKLVQAKELSWKKETLGPLLKSNRGKGIESLGDWELALSEVGGGEAFFVGGYSHSERFQQIPIIKKLISKIMAVGLRCAGRVYVLYRNRQINTIFKNA